jgi:hypothetical protein
MKNPKKNVASEREGARGQKEKREGGPGSFFFPVRRDSFFF